MYGSDDATTIINNCDTYLYMGGMDLKTGRSISERLNVPLEDVLYMPCLLYTSRDFEKINKIWSKHALALAVIQGIRNKSAHEAAPITRENFQWLIDTLFDGGELLRIAELANWSYPS